MFKVYRGLPDNKGMRLGIFLSIFLTPSIGLSLTPGSQEEFLEMLIVNNEKVKNAYNSCQKNSSDGVMSCVWNNLDDKTKDDIKDGLEIIGQNTSSGDQVKVQFTGLNLFGFLNEDKKGNDAHPASDQEDQISAAQEQSKNKEYRASDDIRAIGNFYQERLNEVMRGEGTDKRIYSDHMDYYRLYEAQLSRNTLEAISGFCVEAVPIVNNRGRMVFYRPLALEQRQKIRSHYIDNLLHQKTEGGQNLALHLWQQCAFRIQSTCEDKVFMRVTDIDRITVEKTYKDKYDITQIDDRSFDLRSNSAEICDLEDLNISKLFSLPPDLKISFPTKEMCRDKGYLEQTKRFACGVANYLSNTRQNLNSIKTLQEEMQLFFEEGINANLSFEGDGFDFYDPERSKTPNLTELTILTSADVSSDEIKDTQSRMLKEMEDCLKNNNRELCQKYLLSDAEALQKRLDEFELRSLAMEDKIRNISDDDETIVFLKEEGFDDDLIKNLMTDPDSLKERILHRYSTMKEEVIAQMREQIRRESVDLNDPNKRRKLEDIKKEIESRVNQTRDIVHFNNIVTSYLDVRSLEDGQDKPSRNVASLIAEVNNLHDDISPESRIQLENAARELSPGRRQQQETIRIETRDINTHFLSY